MSDPKSLPARSNSGIAFVYNDHSVTFDENRFIDLTQMWRAAGAQKGKEFKKWRGYEGATFIESLAKDMRVRKADLIRTVIGPPPKGGSWGHWQIALAYAKYLSHEFHRFVNEAFREWAEEKANPDLKAARAVEGYRRHGWDDKRILIRLEGIIQRHSFTDTLKNHGVAGVGYAHCTDAINREVLGGGAKEVKLARGLPASAKTRDHLEPHELAAIRFAEAMAEKAVKDECVHGNGPCCVVCHKAGSVVNQAMVSMGLSAKRA